MDTTLLKTPKQNSWISNIIHPLKVGLAAALATAVVTLFLPNYYRSDARILPVENKVPGGLSQLAGAAAAFGFSVPSQDGSDANYVDILESRWLYESILAKEFVFNQRSWRFAQEKLHKETLYHYLQKKNYDLAIKMVAKMVMSSRDVKSKMISISVESKSPELSQQMVAYSIKLLETFLLEKGQTRGGAKAAFSTARLAEARGEMDQAEAAFLSFLENNRNYQTSSDPTVRVRGARLEAELKLKQQITLTLSLNREQALLEEKNDVPILNVLDRSNLPIEKSRPARSIYVAVAFMLAAIGTWLWTNREWVLNKLLDGKESSANDEPNRPVVLR